jgi:hypothetical protein
MAYTDTNFKSKKALKDAVKAGAKVGVFSPGPFGGPYNGRTNVGVEGPHYPKPHTWYATVAVDNDGYITAVK